MKLVFLENDLVGAEYVEPYAGGAGVALSLLFDEYASHVHINDLNRSVFAFWDVLLNRTEELCRLVESARLDPAEWDAQREIQVADSPDSLALAFSTFFLNRTSRSGIIGGGMIGGRDQRGGWKIDARFNKPELVARMRRVARFKSRITITGLDAAQYLRTAVSQFEDQLVLMYLDPPYFVKGARLYENFYENADHREIADLVAHLDIPWIVSYDAVPEIGELYSSYECLSYRLNYSAGQSHLGTERMYLSPLLSAPEVDSPAAVPTRAVELARG
jgi:DNA adenine methylase